MTCLAPLALIGLLLLALPIVVHLFKPRKMKEMPFSSLRWLKATHERLSRRIEWHQWLLFLLRAGCIAALVFALAKPLIGFWGARAVNRFVVLDVSRSMAYRDKGSASPLDRAKELAGQLVQPPRVGERTAVLLAGPSPRIVSGPSADASSSAGLLAEIQAGEADGTFSETLEVIRSLLPGRSDRDVELVFLTDNLQGRWEHKAVERFLRDLPAGVKVKIVDTGEGMAANAWIADSRFLTFDDNERMVRAWVGCNREPGVPRSLRLTGIAGVDDQVKAVALKPGTLSRVDFAISAKASVQGQVAELRLEPADALPSDDRFFVNLDAGIHLRVLLIEPETPAPDGRNVGIYLQTATAALASDKTQAIDLLTRSTKAVTANDIQKADVIVLASAAELADPFTESLESRVRGGAGLAVFLGPTLAPAFANQKLHRAQQPAEGLMPFSVNVPDGQGVGAPMALANLRWTHPVLAGLQDPLLSDFTQSRFSNRARLVGAAARNDVIVARFEDDVPAIVDHPLGAGRVLIFNMSANHEWGDLQTKRKSFVPLWDHTLAHLSATGVRRSYHVGDAVTIPLPSSTAKTTVNVTAPGGVKTPHRLIQQVGQTHLHIAEVARAGTYRIETGSGDLVFAVNVQRTDSPLAAMDAATLTEWWSPASVEVVSAESAGQAIDQQAPHWPIWPMLVLLAAILLMAETIYVHRLCPRANPKAAESAAPGKSLVKSTASEPEA